jgi:DNA-binding beta-propeller fold protein YncE
VSRVRFGPGGATEEKTISVGIKPADLDGAHGVTVSSTGDYWYVTLAHGTPYGMVWQYRTGTDEFVDSTTVGLFPATMGISADGSMLFAVNFNLHGQRVPSSVSAVFTPFMDEARKIETCVMPHGSRLSVDGVYHYSTCMMSDQLVEIATDRLEVNRRLRLTAGQEGLLSLDETSMHMVDGSCKPTWVAVAPDDRHLYVPCNGRSEILEIDRDQLHITRTFPTGKAPYNADVSPDGRYLVTTLKGAQAVSVIDLSTGTERQVATTRPVTHGVVITPDSRYAFISNESIGAVPGTVDVIDLAAGVVAASTEVRLQPGGISFWKMETGQEHSGQ